MQNKALFSKKKDAVGVGILPKLSSLFFSYYFAGNKAHLDYYIDVAHCEEYEKLAAYVKDTVHNSRHPTLQLWLGETADSYNGGSANVTDRFVSGFL